MASNATNFIFSAAQKWQVFSFWVAVPPKNAMLPWRCRARDRNIQIWNSPIFIPVQLLKCLGQVLHLFVCDVILQRWYLKEVWRFRWEDLLLWSVWWADGLFCLHDFRYTEERFAKPTWTQTWICMSQVEQLYIPRRAVNHDQNSCSLLIYFSLRRVWKCLNSSSFFLAKWN